MFYECRSLKPEGHEQTGRPLRKGKPAALQVCSFWKAAGLSVRAPSGTTNFQS